MSVTLIHEINMFLGIREQNVTFCLDVSGSMYNKLTTVKEQLIQYLSEQSLLAKFNLNRLFNLIAFSTEVYPWADSMVLWNEATVNKAASWINDLETKTGTNTLDALLTSFQDTMTHGIVLVTDDICDQDPYSLLNQISQVSSGRPVHCIYVTSSGSKDRDDEDKSAIQFLQNLSTITRGSFKIVQIGRLGLEKITPISSPNDLCTMFQLANLTANSMNISDSKNFNINFSDFKNTVTTNLDTTIYNPTTTLTYANISNIPTLINNYVHPKWLIDPNIYSFPSLITFPRIQVISELENNKISKNSIVWSRFRPIRILNNGMVTGLTHNPNTLFGNDIAYTPDAGSLLLNKTIVARSALDGYYYKGKILNQILAHRFMIQFGPNQHGNYKDCTYQDTAVYDIIHYEDAMSHSLMINDKVLAPIDKANEKYAPAEVLDGFEKRSSNSLTNQTDSKITVRFMNGKTRTFEFNEVMWIPDAMFERIKFELNLPSTARKYLEETTEDYANKVTNQENLKTNSSESVIMPRLVYDIWPYFVPFYPLYSNLLFHNKITTPPIIPSSGPIRLEAKTSEPVYYRQMKCNKPAIEAQTVNKNIFDSNYISVEKLEEKIRQQIEKHQHLLSKSDNFSNSKDEKSCDCKCKSKNKSNEQLKTIIHSHSPHESCQKINNVYTKSSDSLCSRHNSDTETENDEIKSNKHYKFYKKLMKELYNDHNHEDFMRMSRSKSVTFSDESTADKHSSCYDDPSWTPYSNHHHQDHDEFDDEYRSAIRTKSINTDVTFGKKPMNNKIISSNNMVDRFGNPKVSIGFTSSRSSVKQRPNSANGSLNIDYEKESRNIKQEMAKKRENERKERVNDEFNKQALRDQYLKNYKNQVLEYEKGRTQAVLLKKESINAAKREINAKNLDRFNSNKIDIEAKEQMKFAHLRHESAKRDLSRMEKLFEAETKEQNKLNFKQMKRLSRDIDYHNRLIIEQAVLNGHQKQLQKNYNKVKANDALREAREQKYRQTIK